MIDLSSNVMSPKKQMQLTYHIDIKLCVHMEWDYYHVMSTTKQLMLAKTYLEDFWVWHLKFLIVVMVTYHMQEPWWLSNLH